MLRTRFRIVAGMFSASVILFLDPFRNRDRKGRFSTAFTPYSGRKRDCRLEVQSNYLGQGACKMNGKYVQRVNTLLPSNFIFRR